MVFDFLLLAWIDGSNMAGGEMTKEIDLNMKFSLSIHLVALLFDLISDEVDGGWLLSLVAQP